MRSWGSDRATGARFVYYFPSSSLPSRVLVPCSTSSTLSFGVAASPLPPDDRQQALCCPVVIVPKVKGTTPSALGEVVVNSSTSSCLLSAYLDCTRGVGAGGRIQNPVCNVTVDNDSQLLLNPHRPQCPVRPCCRLDSPLWRCPFFLSTYGPP